MFDEEEKTIRFEEEKVEKPEEAVIPQIETKSQAEKENDE